MTLSDYLMREKMSLRAFARAIGTPHARTVERYVKLTQRPSAAMMQRIFEVTHGEVTANDFYHPQTIGFETEAPAKAA